MFLPFSIKSNMIVLSRPFLAMPRKASGRGVVVGACNTFKSFFVSPKEHHIRKTRGLKMQHFVMHNK